MGHTSGTGRRKGVLGMKYAFGSKDHPIIGAVLVGSHRDGMGMRTVIRQHENGFSKTIFDITVIPYKVIRHQEWSAEEIPDVEI